MKALPQGTKVRVIKKGDSFTYHGYFVGTIAYAQGEVFEENTIWQKFKDETGFVQYLQDQHFELVEKPVEIVKVITAPVTAKLVVDEAGELLDSELPSKVVYAIVDKDNDIVSCKIDRDKARETKALLGGKRKGVRIFQYVATKEIR